MDFNKLLNKINESTGDQKQQRQIYKNCPYSVSKIVNALHKEFDADLMAKKTFEKHYDDPDSKYYHMTVDEIITAWNEKGKFARENGKSLDDFIGMILEKTESPDTLQLHIKTLNEIAGKKCSEFMKFHEMNIKNKLTFVGRELMLCDPSLKVNGRLDALFCKGDNLFVVDWKNNEQISKENIWEKCKGPLYEYDACDLNLYTVQVYIYVYILRKIYGLTDINIIPLIVRIGTDDYEICSPKIPYSDKLIESIIEFASDEINKKTEKFRS